MPVNVIFCFRAKEKIKVVKGQKEPTELGWQAIGGEEIPYECTVRMLLKPGSNGVPVWNADHEAEKNTMKLPQQFQQIFAKPEQLSEKHGEEMAKWAAGKPSTEPAPEPAREYVNQAISGLEVSPTLDALKETAADVSKSKPWTPAQRKEIGAAVNKRRKELEAEAAIGVPDESPDEEPGGDEG